MEGIELVKGTVAVAVAVVYSGGEQTAPYGLTWGCAANWAALTRIQNALLLSLSLLYSFSCSLSITRVCFEKFAADNLREFSDMLSLFIPGGTSRL